MKKGTIKKIANILSIILMGTSFSSCLHNNSSLPGEIRNDNELRINISSINNKLFFSSYNVKNDNLEHLLRYPQLKTLRIGILDNINLSDLFFELSKIPKLNSLEISNYNEKPKYINEIPSEITGLKNLHMLGFHGFSFGKISNNLSKLKNLSSLSFEQCNIDDFSDINSIQELKYLGLNSIDKITVKALELNKLEHLDLVKIKVLPENLEKLTNLKELYINFSGNNITKDLLKLNKLAKITIANLDAPLNEEDYKIIGQIPNLKTLVLVQNPSTGKIGIKYFKNIEFLNLRYYKTIDLSSEIKNLKNLKELDLSNNNIKNLPEEIGELTALKKLNLFGNNLTEIPKEIGKLINLKELELSNNNIKSLPKEISELINLEKLTLYDNKINTLPKNISNLSNLTYLDLGSNPLSEPEKENIKRYLPKASINFIVPGNNENI